MTSTQPAIQLLRGCILHWNLDLQRWSANGRLLAAAQEALRLEGTPRRLQQLIDQWSSGDFSSIPEIVLLSSADMNGAMGAYAISTGKIYLNKDWLLTAGVGAVGAVLTEELGHHLDAELNVVDTPGDEGLLLACFLNGQALTDTQRNAIETYAINKAGTTQKPVSLENATVSIVYDGFSSSQIWEVQGGQYDDLLIYEGGNDLVDGKDGNDTFVVPFEESQTVLVVDQAGINHIQTPAGTSTLINIEGIQYVGKPIPIVLAQPIGFFFTDPGGGKETWFGSSLDDILVYWAGNDIIDGKEGVDVLSVPYVLSECMISRTPDGVVHLKTPGARGQNTLIGVETIGFLDSRVTLDIAYVNSLPVESKIYDGFADSQVWEIQGGIFDDLMIYEGGSDILDGKEGNDTFVVAYDESETQLFLDGAGVYHLQTPVGTSILVNIEKIQYAASSLTLNQASGSFVTDPGGGEEMWFGTSADDVLVYWVGNDTINGNEGIDTLSVQFNAAECRISKDPAGVIRLKTPGVRGQNTLIGIESIGFLDGKVDLDAALIATLPVESVVYDGFGDTQVWTGTDFDDLLIYAGGNDLVDGRAGNDTLVVAFIQDQTTLVIDQAGINHLQTPAGFANLVNIENIQYTDGIIAISQPTGSIVPDPWRDGETWFGTDTDDILVFTGGFDFIDGKLGTDTLSVPFLASQTTLVVDQAGISHLITPARMVTVLNIESISFLDAKLAVQQVAGPTILDPGRVAESWNGTSGDETLVYSDGNDIVDGGEGIDTLSVPYNNAETTLTIDPAGKPHLKVPSARGDITLMGIEQIATLDSVGTLSAAATSNTFIYYDPSLGRVFTSDSYIAPGAVTEIILLGTAGINATGNALDNSITGSDGNNLLVALAGSDSVNAGLGNDTLDGGAGSDTLIGGDGIDTVTYAQSTSGVVVDLAVGTANSATEGADSLSLIENVIGSGSSDTVTGDANANVIESAAGNDIVNAGGGTDLIIGGSGQGNDTYDGGADIDTLRYTSATFGVVVNLKLGTATDSAAGKSQPTAALRIDNDIISNIENIETGIGNDDVAGSASDNLFVDQSATDTDTARLSGALSDYTVSLRDATNPSLGIVIHDNIANRDGTDTFVNYERFVFGSATYIWNPTAARLELADNTPPTITGITVSGNQVLLQFSEAINTANLPATARFTVRVANLVRNVTGRTEVAGDPTQLRLTIAVTPTSSQTVTVAYTDLTSGNDATGVVQDLAGSDMATTPTPVNATTFSSTTSVTSLAANYLNLTLTGTSAINGTGNALNNRIIGNTNVNVLTGAGGTDALDGGANGDRYVIVSALDHPGAEIQDTGTTGIDELRFASTTTSQTLTVFAGDTGLERVVIGTGTAATATSTATTALSINASAALNALTVIGNYGVNSLIGTGFNDLINGNRGNDNLTGGLGADTFRFDSTLNATTNRDTIIDFSVGQGDRFELENAVFTALTATSVLNANAFVVGAAATTAAHRIIYNSTTGTLTYDSNGNAAGGTTVFAQLGTGLELNAGMFTVT